MRAAATATVAELHTRRAEVRDDLAQNRRHVVGDLHKPAPEIAHLPIGDLLCWCEGLDEGDVSRILAASEINWGRRVSRLAARDVAMLCFQIKARHPQAWARWRESLRKRRAA